MNGCDEDEDWRESGIVLGEKDGGMPEEIHIR